MLALVLAGMVSYVFAQQTDTVTATATATVTSIFDVAFYPRPLIDFMPDGSVDASIKSPTGAMTFPPITGSESMVYPSNRSANDGFSDIGILCLSNLANNVPANRWGLKMRMTGNIPSDNIVVYVSGAAWDRNATTSTNLGGVQMATGWNKVPTTDTLLYRADDNHLFTTTWGTLMTFSFAIVPSGKLTVAGQQYPNVCQGSPLPAGSYNASIIFTMTTSI